MKNNFVSIALAVLLIVLLLAVSDPFMLWMPPMGFLAAMLCAALLLCVWAGFVMYERVTDERETLHRMHAGRAAYLSGIGVLTAAFVVQGFSHAIDPWISAALAVMVVAKLVARLYADRYQ